MPDTKYRYITSGPNWAWGRNKIEQQVWLWLWSVCIISFSTGAVVGVILGLKLWNALKSYEMSLWWPTIWTAILALGIGTALMTGSVTLAYRIMWPIIVAKQNMMDEQK